MSEADDRNQKWEIAKQILSFLPTIVAIVDSLLVKFQTTPILPVSPAVVAHVGVITIIGSAATGFAGYRSLGSLPPLYRWPAWIGVGCFVISVVLIITLDGLDERGPYYPPVEIVAISFRILYFLVFCSLGFAMGGFLAPNVQAHSGSR
jgi:hypothetical protein